MKVNCTSSLALSLLLGVSTAAAQDSADPLPRRGYFGVALETAPEGVRVSGIAPGSTAEAAGIQVGDAIASVDGQSTGTTAAVIAAIGHHHGGDSVSIGVRRNGALRIINASLKTYPLEEMENASLHYASVESQPGVRLRTITSVPSTPSGKRFPAVLLIQGGGCGSIDTPIGPPVAQPGLMHAIGSRGFVTMRVDKSGVGDSGGPPCDTIGFKEEMAGYRAALAALRSHPAVDPDRIYLLGISLGGVFTPLLASETHVAGIIVWGASSEPPPPYPGRSERFFDEFAHIDVAGAWAKVGTRVEVLHGEYDVEAYINRAANERIAAIVNGSNGGAAEFKELPGLDHCWSHHASLEASEGKCGQGEPSTALTDAILRFLESGQ